MGRGDLTCVLVVGYLPAVGVMGDVDFERGILSVSGEQRALWGFRSGERGTHTTRTIMLEELSLLLEAAPVLASDVDYAHVVIDENCLGKRTRASRKLTLQRLTELYGLNRRLVLFRVVGDLWGASQLQSPAPGPAARAGARPVAPGYQVRRDPHPIRPGDLQTIHDRRVGGSRRSPEPADDGQGRAQRLVFVDPVRGSARQQHQDPTACVRDACGHRVRAAGRVRDRQAGPTPVRFETPWCAILDAGAEELVEPAAAAKRLGLLDLKRSEPMIDVSFATMLADTGRESIDGPHRQAG